VALLTLKNCLGMLRHRVLPDRTAAATGTAAAVAEIAALRQKLAAAAARIQEEMGRHKATEEMGSKISYSQMPSIREPKFQGTAIPVKPGRGRPKGSRNKMSRDLMEMVMQAAENVGFIEKDENGNWVATRKGGVLGYLE
jgi:hypothetical protein